MYVNTPETLLYVKLPSPPASVTLINPVTSASVLSVKLTTPVLLSYAKSPPALIKPLTCDSSKVSV